jgi:hypothetical protein
MASVRQHGFLTIVRSGRIFRHVDCCFQDVEINGAARMADDLKQTGTAVAKVGSMVKNVRDHLQHRS